MNRKDEIIFKIHKSALEEFISSGLDSASMERIAQEASISKRTLYKYFPNKEKIFADIVDDLLDRACSGFDCTYIEKEPIEVQISKIVENKIKLFTDSEFLKISKLVFAELIKSHDLKITQLEKYQASEQKFINWIDIGKKEGAILSTQESSLISNQLNSIIKGQIFYPVMFGFKTITNEDIEMSKTIAISFFLNSFCK